MSKWVQEQFPKNAQIWTDSDLTKWMFIAFIAGFIIGVVL
jgi:hypothetical protein